MGTRADFYVGTGKDAEWIGSVAYDGYQWGERIEKDDHNDITAAKTEQAFREAVKSELNQRHDSTHPENGWPWPWENSMTTDCAYCFDSDGIKAFRWGKPWDSDAPAPQWPDFSNQEPSAKAGSTQSGIILVE